MTLDEAIKHCEEVMIENLEKTRGRNASDPIAHSCFECADEHRQIAAWLRELKARRESEKERHSGLPKTEMRSKELEAMPKHEKCFYYEPGEFTVKGENGKHYCVPDGARTLGDRWKMKQKIDPEKCEDCQRYRSRYIGYPLTISNLEIKAPEPWGIDPALCRARPAKDAKTYLGIYIGEIPRYTTASFNEESGTLKISSACNPMIYIPELDRTVFGDESWWSHIEPGEDITDITDETIRGQWYMKLLEKMARDAKEEMQ